VINNPPGSGSSSSRVVDIEGHPPADPKDPAELENRIITPAMFDVMRIPLTRGRGFTTGDRADSQPVAIISESAARKYWPNEDPIGRRFRVGDGAWTTVVGLSGDIIHDWFIRRNVPTMYRPASQAPPDYFAVVVRTAGDPTSVAGAVRQALLRVDPNQPVFDMMTMRRQLHERTIGLQYLSAIMGTFAVLALILAAVGLYAVVAYFVAQRRHEIGLRMALGASAADVVRMTVRQAFTLTAIGTLIGLGLSVALARVMESGVLGIATADAGVFAGFAAILMGTALLAGYLPARRAASIDPMVALRAE